MYHKKIYKDCKNASRLTRSNGVYLTAFSTIKICSYTFQRRIFCKKNKVLSFSLDKIFAKWYFYYATYGVHFQHHAGKEQFIKDVRVQMAFVVLPSVTSFSLTLTVDNMERSEAEKIFNIIHKTLLSKEFLIASKYAFCSAWYGPENFFTFHCVLPLARPCWKIILQKLKKRKKFFRLSLTEQTVRRQNSFLWAPVFSVLWRREKLNSISYKTLCSKSFIKNTEKLLCSWVFITVH